MATGNELFIGFHGLRDVTTALATLGVTEVEFEGLDANDEDGLVTAQLADLADPDATDNWLNWDLQDLILDKLDCSKTGTAVAMSYRKALEAAGFTVLPHTRADISYISAETPLGTRKFYAWSITLYRDLDTREIFLGISLSGRYKPTFCDWKNENGTLNPIIFNDELRGMVEIAEGLLTAAWPHLKNASLMVLSKEY